MLFKYDTSLPLDLQGRDVFERHGASLHDVSYVSPKGGRVNAYLVVPKGKGPFGAIVFGHWGHGTRAEFLPEALLCARAGVVSLLVDYV